MKTHTGIWSRPVLIAAIAAAGALLIGYALEWSNYGLTQADTFERVRHQTEGEFRALSKFLGSSSERLATTPDIALQLSTESSRQSRTLLFNLARDTTSDDYPHVATTIYDGTATARAWTGRPTELPLSRILGTASTFIVETPLGLRLIVLHPIEGLAEYSLLPDPGSRQNIRRRVGSVASEYVLTTDTEIATNTDEALFANLPVKLDFQISETLSLVDGMRAFSLESPSGEPLLSVTTTDADLALGRTTWRQTVHQVALALFGSILFILTAPAILRDPTRFGSQLRTDTTLQTIIGLTVASAALWLSGSPVASNTGLVGSETLSSNLAPNLLRTPADVLLLGLAMIVIGTMLVRLSGSTRVLQLHKNVRSNPPAAITAHLLAAIASIVLVFAYDRLLSDVIGNSYLDLAYPSLNPWDTSRISLLLGLLLLAAASQWIAASTLSLTASRWRIASRSQGYTIACWAVPLFGCIAFPELRHPSFIAMSIGPLMLALSQPLIRQHYRKSSQLARFVILFGLLAIPAVIAYPRVVHVSAEAKIRFVEDRFSPSTASHPQRLLESLSAAQSDIDNAIPLLRWPNSARSSRRDSSASNLAFAVWQGTELARLRLTSAIELYGADDELLSRFALNLPEYTTVTQPMDHTNCDWEVYGEVSPFGSQERRLLHAQRGICLADDQNMQSGTIVVHVPLDYRSLPFGSTPAPYYSVSQPDRVFSERGHIGANIDVAVYGWGLNPLFTTKPDLWSIDDALFEKIYATRIPFWAQLAANNVDSHVHFSNNRYGIYALGFPILTIYDHLVRIAEIISLLGIAYLLWVFLLTTTRRLIGPRNLFGYGLLREVRTSFYRRLFLAFVVGAVIPILLLAIVVRNYSIAQLQRDAETFAARTAIIAQRVVAELRDNADIASPEITDDLLVFVSQVIDQDVNIFEGSRLVATSERDLFASGLLSTRTPDEVYEAIALSQLPSFVTTGSIGRGEYLVAAAPLRPGVRDSILTVPMASRQYEIDQQIDEFDRGLLLAVMLLILLGAISSYYIAERIANPVQQLTKATKRITQGKYDEPIVTRTADELDQLVSAFNQMANELARQRRELAYTNRLKAWAEMARQVAHEIKNPLTPVQLSAEHLLRVHQDKGQPLGPVLENCVMSILKQVRTLRQISSDFSSYGTSPEVHKRQATIDDIVSSVIDPYRHGLSDAIEIRTKFSLTPIQLCIDPVLVARALTNIVENALHAMPTNGLLSIETTEDKDVVQIIIRDTGVGFDEATRLRIFEPYFSTKVTGTGLGMAIAKRNIELNGGSIFVDSASGIGTTVTVCFPSSSGD